jgi:hypothetical protein
MRFTVGGETDFPVSAQPLSGQRRMNLAAVR